MKKIILMSIGCMMMTAAVFADNDKPITANELPAEAKQFIEKYFPDAKIAFAKMEDERFYKNYDVVLTNGIEVEFDENGQWNDVDCRRNQEVPAGIVPQQIIDYVAANWNGAKIRSIDRDRHDYEIDLTNGLELTFDLNFNLIDIDD